MCCTYSTTSADARSSKSENIYRASTASIIARIAALTWPGNPGQAAMIQSRPGSLMQAPVQAPGCTLVFRPESRFFGLERLPVEQDVAGSSPAVGSLSDDANECLVPTKSTGSGRGPEEVQPFLCIGIARRSASWRCGIACGSDSRVTCETRYWVNEHHLTGMTTAFFSTGV